MRTSSLPQYTTDLSFVPGDGPFLIFLQTCTSAGAFRNETPDWAQRLSKPYELHPAV